MNIGVIFITLQVCMCVHAHTIASSPSIVFMLYSPAVHEDPLAPSLTQRHCPALDVQATFLKRDMQPTPQALRSPCPSCQPMQGSQEIHELAQEKILSNLLYSFFIFRQDVEAKMQPESKEKGKRLARLKEMS